jgi:hypothetical protein
VVDKVGGEELIYSTDVTPTLGFLNEMADNFLVLFG